MPARLMATFERLFFVASRSWRRRRALLAAELDSDSEPDSIAVEELDEESDPAEEVLDSGHTVARMSDRIGLAESEQFDAEDLPSDNWDADDWVPEESDAAAVPDSLYNKLMQSCADEHSSSNDSSAELMFSPGEYEPSDEDSGQRVVTTERAEYSHADTAIRGETMADKFFDSEDDDVISGDAIPTVTSVYPAMPEGLLDAADSDTPADADMNPPTSSDKKFVEDSPEQIDLDNLDSGAVMNENTETNGSKHELATASRMERLKPKSANSLTGAPLPKVDGRVEDSVLAPETEVLLVAVHAPERNTFRTYLRRHDIPCRAAISAENAVAVVLGMKPAAVLISGSGMNPEEIITLVDDLNDMVDAPVLTLLTEPQINLLRNDPLSSHVLQYPASLRHIRTELTRILTEEGNAKPRCSLRSALMPE